MSMAEVSGIEKHGVAVAVEDDENGIRVRLAGNADSRVKNDLQALLLETHMVARQRHIPRVLVDFRDLEFMNSACFKAFVLWLAELRGLARDQQYCIHFVSNPNIYWQRRSLYALSCFAADLVRIERS